MLHLCCVQIFYSLRSRLTLKIPGFEAKSLFLFCLLITGLGIASLSHAPDRIVVDMNLFLKRKQGMSQAERRRFPRRQSEGTQVHMYAHGKSVQRCKVRDISRAGLFILSDNILPLELPVELVFTCVHTRKIVKIYRRSAYVARASEDGMAVHFFDW